MGDGNELDKAHANEVTGTKIKLDPARGHSQRSAKLAKSERPFASALVAGGELDKQIELLQREIDALAAANRSGDPANSYLNALRVRASLLKVADAAQRGCPTPAMIERLVQLDPLATKLIAAAFHPSAAALAEAMGKTGERPTWRREASIWGGAPIAIKLPPALPPTTPPGLLPDSPLIPKVVPPKKDFIPQKIDDAVEAMKPPKAPGGFEIPQRHETPGVSADRPGTKIVKSPGIPFDETAPLRLKPKPLDEAKHIDPKPADKPAPAAKPAEKPSSLLDHLNFIPHVAIYNAWKAYQDMRKREA
ncbi:MAG TPA: hypothetical protein VFQ65_01450, partial [Kofleriaceae bacterium]|nr:hypothetical protein [Kofleriaceae bacterium]